MKGTGSQVSLPKGGSLGQVFSSTLHGSVLLFTVYSQVGISKQCQCTVSCPTFCLLLGLWPPMLWGATLMGRALGVGVSEQTPLLTGLPMVSQGKLEDGTEFDSSLPQNQPFVFSLGTGQVTEGLDQGLLEMCEGEKQKLVIPSELGYGEQGASPKIPGGATLVFEVELLKIKQHSEL